ncbi:zinc finger protein GLIS3-like [Ptychodera flava]|uniref:zinc finger protein GLIS3-like n=1 Tax=Ptychodera flava TaxID=63121 RepID=UPI003969F65A
MSTQQSSNGNSQQETGQNGRTIPPIRVQSETPAPPSNTATPIPGLHTAHHNGLSNTPETQHVQLPKLSSFRQIVSHGKNDQKTLAMATLHQDFKRELQNYQGNATGDTSKDSSSYGPQVYGINPQSNTAHGLQQNVSNPIISRYGALPLQNRTNLPLQQTSGVHRQGATPALSINNASPTPSDISSIQFGSRNQSVTPVNTVSQGSMPSTSTSTTVKGNGNDKQFLGPLTNLPIKQEWQKYHVLPGLSGQCSHAGELSDQNFPPPGSALSQYPSSSTSLSPFPIELSPSGSSFASPRGSARSYSARSKKRALSLSPLSTEGFNINDIIRTSPTSLVSYINGSRGSSCSVSPAPGLQPGEYGHLSVRNSPLLNGSFGHSSSHSAAHSRQSSLSLPPPYPASKNQQLYTMPSENSNLAFSQMSQQQQTVGNMQVHSQLVVQQYSDVQQDFVNLNIYKSENVNSFPAVSLPTTLSTSMPTSVPPSSQAAPPNDMNMPPPPSYQQHITSHTTMGPPPPPPPLPPPPPPPAPPPQLTSPRTVKSEPGENGEQQLHMCKWIDCNAIFNEQEDLVRHIEKVHIDQRKGDDFTCFWQGCGRRYKPFNARYKLLIHMRVHSGEKPNKCTFEGCNKAFSRLENLKIHLRSHTGERPYLCQFSGCNKAFSNSSDRAKHQRTHLDTKPYACQIPGCTKRYTDPSSLRKHVKAHTAKEQQARKKFRTTGEYSPHQDMLTECLTIQPLQPIPPPTDSHGSPMDLSDSGLGRSPHSSIPGTSSDVYPGIYSSAHSSRSGTATGASSYSNHPSPVHSMTGSPLGQVQQMNIVDDHRDRSGNYGTNSHQVSPTRRSYPPTLLPRRQPQVPLSIGMKVRSPAVSSVVTSQTSLPPTSVQGQGLVMSPPSAPMEQSGHQGNPDQQSMYHSINVHQNNQLIQRSNNVMLHQSMRHPSPRQFANIPTFEETLSPTVPYDTLEKVERVLSARSLTIERALSAHSLTDRVDLPNTPSDYGRLDSNEMLQMNAVDRCPSQLSAIYAD